jgi:hypothetical protein
MQEASFTLQEIAKSLLSYLRGIFFFFFLLQPFGQNPAVFADVLEADGDLFRDAGFLHGHAVDGIGAGHGFLRMRDDDELRPGEEIREDLGEAVDVRFVERGIDFVEHAERAGAAAENRQEERHAGQGLFAAA